MSVALTIAGSTVNLPGARVQLNRLHLDLDEPDVLEFAQLAKGLASTWHPGQVVLLSIDGNPRFAGEIVSVHKRHVGGPGYITGYHCQGLKYVGNKITITNAGIPPASYTFNLASDDPDYQASLAGKTVGNILTFLLDQHATALVAAGIGTAGAGNQYVAADLAALTVVPPEPVYVGGPLFSAIDNLLDQWAGPYSCLIPYRAVSTDWRVRFLDSTALTSQTLTLGIDPIDPPEIDRDTTQSASRVVVRGAGIVQGALLDKLDGGLIECFPAVNGTPNPTGNATVNAAAKAAWALSDFTEPKGAIDSGTINTLGSTSVVVQSTDPLITWAANYWSARQANIWITNISVANLNYQEQRRVTSNTALTAGGTCTISWDSSQPVAATGFTKYRVIGTAAGGLNECWRRYGIVNTDIANALVKRSQYPIPFANNSAVVMTNYPMSVICWSNSGSAPFNEFPLGFQLDIPNHQVLFNQPVVQLFGTKANLQTGGASTDGIPGDIKLFLLYSKGVLSVASPVDVTGTPQYAGTSYTVDGIARTWTYDVGDAFSYVGDIPSAQALADMLLKTVQDSVVTGQVVYHGKLVWALTMGSKLNIAADYGAGAYTTGWEALGAPVRSVTLEWPTGGADAVVTVLALNNRRKRASGDRLYVHPIFQGGGVGGFDDPFASFFVLDEAGNVVEGKRIVDDQGMMTGAMAFDAPLTEAEDLGGDWLTGEGADEGNGFTPEAAPGGWTPEQGAPSGRFEEVAPLFGPEQVAPSGKFEDTFGPTPEAPTGRFEDVFGDTARPEEPEP